jgi:ATP-dependent exoDNAse (exonuclease V) alpha subunit
MKRAMAGIARGESPVFITGGAGTGKSTLLNAIHEKANATVAVLAPTGAAAMTVRGSTIHSFFGLPPRLMTHHQFRFRPSQKDLLNQLSGIIIDEISMVRSDLLDAIDTCLKMHLDATRPFGGLQVVFLGDLLQLPPIVDGDDLKDFFATQYDSHFFFDSAALRFCPLNFYRLPQVFRQKDTGFTDLLNRLRRGAVLDDDLRMLNRRITSRNPTDSGIVTLTSTRKAADDVNRIKLAQLSGDEKHYKASTEGNLEGKDAPAEEILRLKVGAKVMLLTNYGKLWHNGSLGQVVGFGYHEGEEAIRIRLADTQNEHWITRKRWEILRYVKRPGVAGVSEEVAGVFNQFPLKLAWAITIHKSQGMTFDAVHIDLQDRAFEHGQLYVALSRCRSIEGISLRRAISRSDIHIHPRVNWFQNMNSLW